VENCIDVVSFQTVHDFGGIGDVSMIECEVSFVVQDSSVV
jgi:hypothetical protein